MLFFIKKLTQQLLSMHAWCAYYDLIPFKTWTRHCLCDTGFALSYWVSVAVLEVNPEVRSYRLLVIQVFVKCLQIYFLNSCQGSHDKGYRFLEAHLLSLSPVTFTVSPCTSMLLFVPLLQHWLHYFFLNSCLCINLIHWCVSSLRSSTFSVWQSTMAYTYRILNKY